MSTDFKIASLGMQTAAVPVALPNVKQLDKPLAEWVFWAASYLTDPACKTHELWRRIDIVDTLHPEAWRVTNFFRKCVLRIEMCLFAALALPTGPLGIGLRGLGIWWLGQEQFLYVVDPTVEKRLPLSRTFSLLSWNICCIGAGYSISDGGVLPWRDRIERIIQQIIDADADVNCIYETFDIASAFWIMNALRKKGYGHFYFNIGPLAVGVPSGMFVASKYPIGNPTFTRFPVDSAVGRIKYSAKGVFTFDLQSQGKSFAHIATTHLQSSEISCKPTDEEVAARKKQMAVVVDKVKAIKDRTVIVTGDLNLDTPEYEASDWKHLFEKKDRFKDKTWGGDGFCARLMGITPSPGLNLDHTMVLNNGQGSLEETALIETGFDGEILNPSALSDHRGLRSLIRV
jgi:Metal-dependent hydrolase